MSDLKIVNGRIGKDKYGEYTCQTKQGQSTIDYAIMSMEQYTMEFNVDEINTLQQQFTNVLQGIDHVTQHIVDSLYINIKNMLINPARNTGIYRERKRKTKHINKKPRRHGLSSGLRGGADGAKARGPTILGAPN